MPEQQVTASEFEKIVREIKGDDGLMEDIDLEQLECENGACPI